MALPVLLGPCVSSAEAEAAYHMLRTRPRVLRLTPGRRDRIVREVRAERAGRDRLPRSA